MTAHSPGKPLPPLRPLTSAERAMVERSFAEGANLRETMLLVGVPHFDTYSKPLAEKVAALRAAGATWDAVVRGTGIDIGPAALRKAASEIAGLAAIAAARTKAKTGPKTRGKAR